MKRLKIWLSSFNLIQQFISVIFLTIFVVSFFFYTYLRNNIATFANEQMYSYLHRSQDNFITAQRMGSKYDDPNVSHYVYSINNKRYLSATVDNQYLLNGLNISEDGDKLVNNNVICSVRTFEKDYKLVSLINDTYRSDFIVALSNATINIIVLFLTGMFIFFVLWIISLIRSLDKIKNYINGIKNGEDVELKIKREDEIGAVAEALTSMNQELSDQKRIREEMIQNISHDLKTPIATIKSYSESIKDGIYPYGSLEKSVDVIIEHADRLEQKVYSLNTFNKMGYLQVTYEGQNIAMAEVISKAILSCKVLRNEVEIITDIDEDVYFHGEEESWRVVVENLLDNALRYAKTEVIIRLKEDLLEVYNNGEIMSKDRIEKLFKPYEKGNKGNFGLGLSIVYRVADTYGYSVTGENMDDGVVFRIFRKHLKKQKR